MAKISCDFYPFLTAAHNFSVFEKKEDIYAVNLMTLLVILLTKGQSLPLCVFKKKKKKFNHVNKNIILLRKCSLHRVGK